MYRNGILALLVALGAAGWSEAQTVPTARMPSGNMPTTRMPSTNSPTVNPSAGRLPSTAPGNQVQGTRFQNGNPGLPPNMQIMPRQNPALGQPAVIPQGSQANVPLQGNGNTFIVNGGGGQQPAFNSLGLQMNPPLQANRGTTTTQPAFNRLGLQTNAPLQRSSNPSIAHGVGVSGQINGNTIPSSNGVSPRR